MSSKKLFFCGTAGFDNPGAWSKLMTEEEAREFGSVDEALMRAKWLEKPLKTFCIERHVEGEDSRVYIWGEEEPGFSDLDAGQHVGYKVEIDGVLVYSDLKPSGDSDPEDHEDEECECKVRPAKAEKPKKNGAKK